jgi:hypothetical protein
VPPDKDMSNVMAVHSQENGEDNVHHAMAHNVRQISIKPYVTKTFVECQDKTRTSWKATHRTKPKGTQAQR